MGRAQRQYPSQRGRLGAGRTAHKVAQQRGCGERRRAPLTSALWRPQRWRRDVGAKVRWQCSQPAPWPRVATLWRRPRQQAVEIKGRRSGRRARARCAAVIVLCEIDHRSFIGVVAVAEQGRVTMALVMVVTMLRRSLQRGLRLQVQVCAPQRALRGQGDELRGHAQQHDPDQAMHQDAVSGSHGPAGWQSVRQGKPFSECLGCLRTLGLSTLRKKPGYGCGGRHPARLGVGLDSGTLCAGDPAFQRVHNSGLTPARLRAGPSRLRQA